MGFFTLPFLLLGLLAAPFEKNTDWGVAKAKGMEVISFTGPITTDSVNTIISAFIQALNEKPKVLIFEIDSHGGLVDDGARLAKFIEQYPVPVHCIADRMAHSIAFYVFQSCDKRLMTKRAELLAHGPSVTASPGSIAEHETDLVMLKLLNEAMMEHEVRKMKISLDELRKKTHRRDWRMGWKEALAVGAVDEVVETSLNYVESL